MKCLLCVFIIFFTFSISWCEQSPKLKVIGYEPSGIRVSIPDEEGIEEFYFWGNINEEIDNRNNADIRVSAFEATDGEWVAEDDITVIKKGDVINYYLYYKKGGVLTKYEPRTVTVKEIQSSPNSVEVSTLKPKKQKKPTTVVSCPHVNVKSNDVVLDFYGYSDIEKANLDKLTYIKLDDCLVDYKVATGGDPSLLEIKIL